MKPWRKWPWRRIWLVVGTILLVLLGYFLGLMLGPTNSLPIDTNRILAATALIAVIVGPVASIYIARRQIRASVVSANRQVWINNLRDAVSEFLAKEAMARTYTVLHHADGSSLTRIEEVVHLCYRIELLINPKESDHTELIEAISQLGNTTNQQNEKNKGFNADAGRERVLKLSQAILKREWERVKSGE